MERVAESPEGVRDPPPGREALREALRSSETIKAAGLAAATLAGNAISLLFTIVFARLLGEDYASLAVLVAAFLILAIGGSALQVAAARETALGNLGGPDEIAATLSGWLRHLALFTAALTIGSVLLRDPIAHVIGSPDDAWAAAAVVPTGCLWLALSLQRGVLQGLHSYTPVGASIVVEASGRLIGGLILVLAGAGVTGAYLGTPIAMVVTMIVLEVVIRRRVGPPPDSHEARTLRALIAEAWVPIAALTLLAILQNVDVIVMKHLSEESRAASYAAATVAAKLVIWVAIGIGLYLLPEATRRGAAGEDARGVLLRALGVMAIVAVPALLIFAVAPKLLLTIAFGSGFTEASGALIVLGGAMTLLAAGYLAVQYLLALRHVAFVWVLIAAAVAEPFVLAGPDLSLVGFAAVVLAVQAFAAAGVLGLALRTRTLAR